MDKLSVLIILSCVSFGLTFPTSSDSLIVSSTEVNEVQKEKSTEENADPPEIYEMVVKTDVSNRFGRTLITSKVKNPSSIAQQATFTVILPDSAYISEFIMEIGGKSYKAYVKEKREAKQIYDEAVASGRSAGHVAVTARDSNRFTVSVNIEGEEKAIFYLTYEELLERRNDMYEIVLNINPRQIVKDLDIKVNINESKKLRFVKTPSLRSGNEISKNNEGPEPNTNVQIISDTSAVVTFNPDVEQQKQFAEKLGGEKEYGFNGQFIVQYDVERDNQGGQILLKDGYFAHFFAPKGLTPIPKCIVFVLDRSGSMYGEKMHQLKTAMDSILSELRNVDVFSIVDFDDNIRVWDIPSSKFKQYGESPLPEFEIKYPGEATAVTDDNIGKAKELVKKVEVGGSTNIIGGLEAGLYLLDRCRKYESMLIFLTDGEPNRRLSSPDAIIEEVGKLNNNDYKVRIFSLSFGDDADKDFLRKLSLKNAGFSRHIYEAADAHLQLHHFYQQISTPLMDELTFEYGGSSVHELTRTKFPIYFSGSEIIVAGKYDDSQKGLVNSIVWGNTIATRTHHTAKGEISSNGLERLWVYLTIKQKLEERDVSDNKDVLEKEALDLALKYSFVTPVSSLVVVKPNETSCVETEDGSKSEPGRTRLSPGFGVQKDLQANAVPASSQMCIYFINYDIRMLLLLICVVSQVLCK